MTIDAAVVWIRKDFETWDEAKAIMDAAKVLGLGVRLYVSGSCKVEGWEKRKGEKTDDVGFFLKQELELMHRYKGDEHTTYIGLMQSGKPEVTLVEGGRFFAEIEIGTED